MASFDEKKNEFYLLNGRKVFIPNERITSVFVVLAKTVRNLLKPSKVAAMFIVDADTPGVSIGKTEEQMGATPRCSMK